MGSASACALMMGGGVMVLGSDNGSGELGNDSTTVSSQAPVAVNGLTRSGVGAVSVGRGYACALLNGGVQCWGDNGF